MSVQGFIVRYVTFSGHASSTEVWAHTATDAIEITRGPEYARRVASARLSISPHGLHRAAYRVARELVKGEDAGFIMVADAVAIARDTLRLPESEYVAGAYPLEDEGSATDTAFRAILEATPDELTAAGIGPMASVRAR